MRRRLPLERICAQYGFGFFAPEKSKFASSTASDRKGFVKGESVPLDPLLPPFGGAKGGPRRVGALTKPCKRLRDADRRDEMVALIFAVNPSVSLAADSSPYTGEPVGWGDGWLVVGISHDCYNII